MPTQPMKTLTIFCSLLFICIVNACGDPNQLSSDIPVASQDENPTEVQDNNDGKFDRPNEIDHPQKPIQALYLTNYGNFWHNYEAQKNILFDGLSRHVSIEFDLVHFPSKKELELTSFQ